MKHTLFVAVMAILCTCTAMAQTTAQPNVLFIIFDDMNDWVEGFGGHPQTITPNLLSMEERGTTFTSAYTTSPICGPARTSLLSGKDCVYTGISRLDEYDEVFRKNFTVAKGNPFVVTLPEYLKNNGYYTYSINKTFHAADTDGDYDKGHNPNPCLKTKSWNRKVYVKDAPVIKDLPNEGIGGLPWSHLPDSMENLLEDYRGADSAIAFLQRFSAGTVNTCSHPFFLALGIKMPHINMNIPDKYWLDYYNNNFYALPFIYPYNTATGTTPVNGVIMPPQPDPVWDDYYHLGPVAQNVAQQHLIHENVYKKIDQITPGPIVDSAFTEDEKEEVLHESLRANAVLAYLAAIRFADAQVGRVLDELEAHPELYSNTIIIITSDHGFGMGEKTHWLKSALWETDIRVPMIIIDPRVETGGLVCNKPVGFIDVFPTVCDLLDLDQPVFPDSSKYLDGESFASLISNPAGFWEKPALTTIRSFFTEEASCFPNYSVRDAGFHYIRWRSNGSSDGTCNTETSVMEEELYNVGLNRDTDPNEWNNIINDPDYKIVKEYLQQFIADSSLYLKKPYKVKIIADETQCYYHRGDNIPFSLELNDPDGNVLTEAPYGMIAKWWTNVNEDSTQQGTTVSLRIPDAPEVIPYETNLIVYSALYDTINHIIYAYDMMPYTLYDDPAKYPVYSLRAVKTKLFLKSVKFPSGTFSATVNYGDGAITTSAVYPPHNYLYSHIYSGYGTYPVSVTANMNINGSICSQTTIKTTIIDAGKHVTLRVSPNPVHDQMALNFDDLNGNYKIEIYNTAGTKMSDQLVSGADEAIELFFDTSSFEPGCYFIKITGNDEYEVQSFIKIE